MRMRLMMAVVLTATMLLVTVQAQAASTLKFDLNSVSVQARDAGAANSAFGGLNHTGSLLFVDDPFTNMIIEVAGAPQGGIIQPGQIAATGEILLNNGNVTGGIFSFQTAGDSFFTSFSAVGKVSQLTSGYAVDLILTNASITSASFGPDGVNLSEFFGVPLGGTGLTFEYNPNANGFDSATSVDLNLVSVVPAPAAALGGAVLMAGLFYARRRRALRH